MQVGDELLEINGNSTEGMLHSDAITIIKHGGDAVKLIIRRLAEEMFMGCECGEGPGAFGLEAVGNTFCQIAPM